MRPLVQLNRYGEDLGGLQQFFQIKDTDDRDERQRLLRVIGEVVRRELTPRQREMVELYYFQNHTIPAVARILGVNKSSVSRGLKGARKRLEQYLKYLV